jgi:carbon storage regulator
LAVCTSQQNEQGKYAMSTEPNGIPIDPSISICEPKTGTGTLVLTRRTGEAIRIGDDIEVVVALIRGDKVRLGVKAPLDVPVHREEVYHQIQKRKAGNDSQHN